MVLLQGGFHSTRKYSRETTFVDGPGGVFMGCVFLMLATIAAAVLMRSLGQRRSALVVPALIFLLPPCIFLFKNCVRLSFDCRNVLAVANLHPATGSSTQGQTVEEEIARLREANVLYLSEFSFAATGHQLTTMFTVPESPANALVAFDSRGFCQAVVTSSCDAVPKPAPRRCTGYQKYYCRAIGTHPLGPARVCG